MAEPCVVGRHISSDLPSHNATFVRGVRVVLSTLMSLNGGIDLGCGDGDVNRKFQLG